MLSNGTIAHMSAIERQLYLVLVLAADRRGISFYSDQRIQKTLGCTRHELTQARAVLMARDLLAYDGTTYQLLPLPPDATENQRMSRQPPNALSNTSPPTKTRLPTTPTEPHQCHAMPESVRQTLRDLFGRESF